MYRNSTTSTTTQQSTQQTTTNDNVNIVYAIATSNLTLFKKYINKTNVNKVIDNETNNTSLHLAIQLKKNEIIRYLLELGASTNVKNINNKDQLELSIEYQNRLLFDNIIDFHKSNNLDIQKEVKALKDKLILTEKEAKYLQELINKMTVDKEKLNLENNKLKTEIDFYVSANNDLTRKVNSIDADKKEIDDLFLILSNENISLKRKCSELEEQCNKSNITINNLLEANRKRPKV